MQDVKIDREKYIGGSDIPIIMGLSHFKTRYQLLLEKAQLAKDEFEGNEYTEYGNIMEDKIRKHINEFTKLNFVEDKLEKSDIRCHFDGIDKKNNVILEVKTTSQIHDNVKEYDVYLVQLLFYMMNANIENGMLAVYNRPQDFNDVFEEDRLQIFNIQLHDYDYLCDEIEKAVKQFRNDLQKLKDNPFTTEEELIETSVVELADKVIGLEIQLKKYDELKKKYDEFKEKLRLAMEEHDVPKWITPNGTKITLVEGKPDEEIDETYFDKDKFALENAEMYEKYITSKKVLKKGKKSYVKITLGTK